MMRARSNALTVLTLAVTCAAQGRTWIVDAANGPGTNFTDLPPAVAAASDGDVLIVRPTADYSPVTVGKGITILGNGAWVRGTSNVNPVLDITGVPAGKTLAIRSLLAVNFWSGSVGAALRLQANAGRICLDGVGSLDPEARPIQIAGCKLVTLRNFASGNLSYPQISGSTVVISRSRLTGQGGNYSPPPGGLKMPTPGLVASNSTVVVVDCPATGGGGAYPMWTPPQSYAPQPAIVATSCALTLLGRAADAIAAGSGYPSYYPTPVPAIVATGSVVEIDPAIPLASYLGAPLLTGATSVTAAALAALDAPSTSVGGTLSTSLRSPPGDPFLLALGFPSDPVASPLGTLLVDLSSLVTLATGTQSGSGTSMLTLPIPSDPALRGMTFALQAANGYSGGSRVGLSNPVLLTLD